ncbi:hypothetical protein [Vibrio viridaestus]|uniref:Uncharacterized protein n=1 Tax=Vibrio viridaestus TaxID=2487322 RepID=A0A3N9TB98_9VIBR|nr:hypothetical protein [Vibrio viridaestus]RQW61033.1 hypothetical protein EES38_21530 [Vibrio viridaestus]
MSKKSIFVDSISKTVALSGLYFKVMQASGEIAVEFMLENGDLYETGLSSGQGVRFDQKYKNVRMTSAISQQIFVWSGLGQLTQDSQNTTTLAGSNSIAASVVSVEVETAKQILPAQTGRRSALIQADEPFYIGGSGVTTAEGMPVDESITLETQGEIWVISETAQDIRILEEFN